MPHVETVRESAGIRARSRLAGWLLPTRSSGRYARRLVWALTGLAFAAGTFARLWPSDLESNTTWRVATDLLAFMLLTFQLHIGLFLALGVGIAAWMRMRSAAAVLLIVMGVALAPTLATLWPRREAAAPGTGLRILSVNLFAGNRRLAALVEEIVSAEADVVLVQEYTPAGRALLRPRLAPSYPHAIESPQDDCFGMAVFSRRPFLEPPQVHLPIGETGNPQVRIVVEGCGRPLALHNVHLLPPTGLAYVRRGRREFLDLARIAAAEPLPTVICGDFNFTNDSAQAAALRRAGFRDAFDLVGWGPRWTWPTWGMDVLIPGIRIDHAYLSRDLTATRAAVGVGRGSDHRSVLIDLGVRWIGGL